MLSVSGCASLLGIENPSSGSGSDASVDATDPTGDSLKFSLADFQLAKGQLVRFRVHLMHLDGRMEDVTSDATYMADSDGVAVGMKGTVEGRDSGLATITASLPGAASATIKVTVSTFTCHPVINEFQTGTSTRGADDEFVEIYNPCVNAINVGGWTLNYRGPNAVAAQPDSQLMITLAGEMMSGDIRLYAGSTYPGANVGKWPTSSGMGQNDGAIGLRAGPTDTGPLVDSVAYGTVLAGNPFIETTAIPPMTNGRSAARLPFDGKDDAPSGVRDGDNSADLLIILLPTPNSLNVP